MDNSYQNSTISQILEAIINESSFDGSSSSEIGDILLSILNNTSYDKEPESVIGQLLIKLKAKIAGESFEPYDGTHISRIADILLATLNAEEYNEAPQSKIAELLLALKAKIEDNPEGTASGKIASFTTTLEEGAIQSIEIEFDPDTDLPTECFLYTGGANFFDPMQFRPGAIDDQTGEEVATNDQLRSQFETITGGMDYYIKVGSDKNVSIYWYNIFSEFLGADTNVKNEVITAPEEAVVYRLVTSVDYGTTYLNDISLNYPASNTENNEFIQFTEYFIDLMIISPATGGKIDIGSDGGIYYTDIGGNRSRISELDNPVSTIDGVNNFYIVDGGSNAALDITVNYLKR